MALYKALKMYDVPLILSMIPENPESYMYHVPNITLTKYSAEAIGIPLVAKRTSGKPPQENRDLKNALKEIKKGFEIDGIVAGAVRSNYQYGIISKICKELNLKLFTPYWQQSHEDLIKEAIDAKFEILIVGVYADGFNESWLGRKLDLNALEELRKLSRKFSIDIGGEGGEYETFVVNGPIFKKRVDVLKSKKEWDGVRGEFIIEGVRLQPSEPESAK